MATYLELAQATRVLCGMQGSGPTSVTDNQGIEEVLVRFVNDAYQDIQNAREEWNFLRASRSFSTSAGQDTYTLSGIFTESSPVFKKYKRDSFIITDSNGKQIYLKYRDFDRLEAQYLNEDREDLPTYFSIDPSNNSVVLKPTPNGAYNVNFRYWKGPESLTEAAQVPSLPLPFHNLIVYRATEKMAVYLSAAETYAKYSNEYAKMLGQLMRMEIPKKRMNAGAMV